MKIKNFIKCNISLLFLLFTCVAEANKPGHVGPEINEIQFSVENENVIYAISGNSDVFKSIDKGLSWVYQNRRNNLSFDLKTRNTDRPNNIGELCVDGVEAPSSPNIIYAICYKGSNSGGHSNFKKSVDYGETWEILGDGLPKSWFATNLAVDPRDPSVLFAGWLGGGLFRSLDGGKTWKPSDKGLIDTHESFRRYLMQPYLHKAMLDNDLKQAAKALIKGADIEEVSEGMTPLLLAIDLNLVKLAQFLLDHGANAHAKDSYGNTSLYLAIRKRNPELVKLVLNAGVDVNESVSERSTTAMMFSIDAPINMDIIKLLVNRGANLDDPYLMARAIDYNLKYQDPDSKPLELVKFLFQKGVPLDYENNGNNLVLYAGWLCKPDIVRFFLQKGVPPNLTDEANLRRPSDGNLACYQEAKILIDQLSK
ncbi:ankyrin repeat domain-containing protein [Methylomonas sp. MO1]|uniref:ankyrin repeat domain-containing protein n=1 Tax=Methylomonas sp. MO1 TaxID=3073619 RepID=UPI0028A49C14|nr:ankyrin repeat domain-containing protein [Methylomonas sp. MO1]MDT4292252.1 ankyrin repeat domain-containing protein [Methylomonas sp. MO1]